MHVTIIEKRISARIVDRGKSAEDWFVLLAVALPFEPSVGFEIQLKGKSNTIKLTRVVYNPTNGTFWAKASPVLHPQPNAQEVAQSLVNDMGWDIALEESTLEEATKTLRNKAVKDLQHMLLQAQSRIVRAGGLSLDPRILGRKK